MMKGSLRRFPTRRNRVYSAHIGVTHPELAQEFHHEKNQEYKIENLTHGTERLVWWKCKTCGDEWSQSVFRRVIGKGGCPTCKRNKIDEKVTIAYNSPHLINEWDVEKNGKATPYNTNAGTRKKIHWICSTCKHEWTAMGYSRCRSGSGCPVCVRKKHNQFLKDINLIVRPENLQEIAPMFESCFDVEKNHPVELKHLTRSSGRKIYWTCPSCKHSVLVKTLLFVKWRKHQNCQKCGGKLYEGEPLID